MARITISASDLVILKGTASKGKRAGKEYAFAKLNFNLANSPKFVQDAEKAGATVLNQGEGVQRGTPDYSIEE